MKAQEIRQLSDEELRSEVERLQRRLFDVRTQAVTEKLEDPSMLRKTKRDIARILTIQRQRQSASQQQAPEGREA